MATQNSVGTEPKQVKSSRIKKMMKGLTRSSKSKKNVASDNMSTAISVQAEEMSASTAPAATAALKAATAGKHVTLQLVLLLMDPTTRRFELLQLEFDSDKARVSDILAQIPLSVTEPSIRNQTYDGVIDESANTRNEFVRLIDFCQKKTVLVALPHGLAVKECVRLARPILCDKQVERMLSAGKFDVSGWKTKKEAGSTSKAAPTTSAAGSDKSKPAAGAATASNTNSKEQSSESSIFPTILLVVLLAVVLQSLHKFLAAPIQSGDHLKPGTFKSKCGLMGLVPPSILEKAAFLPKCENAFLEVHDDGIVSIKDAQKEIDFLLKGSRCQEGEENCLEGLVLQDDGKVLVGGSLVTTAFFYGEGTTKSLTPWPFQETPKLKLKNSSRR